MYAKKFGNAKNIPESHLQEKHASTNDFRDKPFSDPYVLKE